MPRTKRVLLADDHTVVRDGIKSIITRLGDNISVVGEARTGREVLELSDDIAVDVFILDLEMPELDGLETISRLKQRHNSVKVVFLSMYDEKITVERAIRAGARGYVLKDAAAEEIVRAIEVVHEGGFYFSPKVAGYLAEDFVEDEPSDGQDRALKTELTERQVEVLKRICQGLTEKETAEELRISPNTVHVHTNNIMRKVQIHNRAGLIKYAIRMGIIKL